MRINLTACIFIFLLAFLNAPAQQSADDSTAFRLDEYFTALTALENFNGNVIISKSGRIFLNQTYNIEGGPDSLKVNEDSRFIIASVSKIFIKFSILKLVEESRLKLDDRLSKFIPDFPGGGKITVEQLMYHRSGLPRELTGYNEYDNLTLEKVVELARNEKLQFEPGSSSLYSNVGYFLLHYIIDRSSSAGYPLFTLNILNEMGLRNTSEYIAGNGVADFAWGFNSEEGKIVPAPGESIDRFETGNYYSTISDMYKFSEEMLSGKILERSLALKMFGEDSTLVQAGGRPGYRAYFYKDLKTGVTFIFLSNFTGIPIQEVTADVINIMENKPYEIPQKINRVEISLDESILSRYTGKYSLEVDASQVLTIKLENGRLYIADEDGERSEMHADTETTFFDDPQSKNGYMFILNEETGKYDLVIISTGIRLKTKRLK